jgi:F0F1-type ATP synthase delta subunit
MAPNTTVPQTKLALPTLIFGIVEVRRLRLELESLDEFLRGMAIRRETKFEMPRVSRMLEALARENQKDLLKGNDRKSLGEFLQEIDRSAPVIHMSFAADPSASFSAKIVGWLRANIHPLSLLEIGLQPTIAAGCIVRTTNKVFDLSLRNRFSEHTELLLKSLRSEPV